MISIETPTDDRALLTLDEVKAAVGVTGSDNDTALTALAVQASDIVCDFCGVSVDGVNPATLLAEEITETVRIATPLPAFVLSRRFVSDIDSVTVAGTELTEDDYELDAASGVLRYLDASDNVVAWPAGKTVVVYTAGFVSAPEPLKAAAKEVARNLWNADGSNPLLRSETHDGYGTFQYNRGSSTDKAVSATVADMLAPYCAMRI